MKVRQVITITEETYKGDGRRVVKELADILDKNPSGHAVISVETRPSRWQSYSKVTAKVTITRGN